MPIIFSNKQKHFLKSIKSNKEVNKTKIYIILCSVVSYARKRQKRIGKEKEAKRLRSLLTTFPSAEQRILHHSKLYKIHLSSFCSYGIS